MTLTINIPDEIADRIVSLTELQREQVAVEAVVSAWTAIAEEDEELLELSDEDIAAINRGIDDAEAGRTISFEEFSTRIRGVDGSPESILAAAHALLAERDTNDRLGRLELG